MNFLKNYLKKIEASHATLFVIGVLFIIYLFKSYSADKMGSGSEQMSSRKTQEMYNQANSSQQSGPEPSAPLGQNESYASAGGVSSSMQGMPPSCSKQQVADPSELLPKNNANDEWAKLNPSGSGDLQDVNLLRSGYHMGIDTVGNSLRNANLQLRSEPANPQVNVGPWNNTTIAADTMRVPLEIGQGCQ
jgi:hypothetical protein